MRVLTPLLLALALLLPAAARAQEAVLDPAPTTRAGLEALRAHHERVAGAPGPRGVREAARRDADAIRARLEHGDFQIGDRILLSVDGHEALTDTFVVTAGRVIVLPSIGEIGLAGTLRSELQDTLAARIGRFIRDPAVQARSLIRISVLGEVSHPGYYVVSTEALVTDALMQAGGPGNRARITAMRIQRGDARVWEGRGLQEAIAEGRTLDQMALRAGDQIIVPARAESRLEELGRTFLWIVPAAVGLITVL